MPHAARPPHLLAAAPEVHRLRRAVSCLRRRLFQEVLDRPTERGESPIVALGNVDLQPFVQRDDRIQEIQRVDIELLAQIGLRIQPGKVRLRRDGAERLDEDRANFLGSLQLVRLLKQAVDIRKE